MSQILHIMRKDLRRTRWLLGLGLAVLTARVVLAINGALAADASASTGLLLQQVWGMTGIIELLLTTLILSRLVHEEPLVGLTPFWLTRPYATGKLLTEKLLLAVVLLIALPLVGDLVAMSLFNARPFEILAAGAAQVIGYASWVLSLMVLAALTPSLGAFVLATLGIAAGASILLATLVGFATLWIPDRFDYTPPGVPDATPGVVMTVVYLTAALSILVYQYRHRRWRVAAGLVVAGLAASIVVPIFWPWPFARGQEIRAGAWASNVTVAHDPSWGTKVIDLTNVSRPMREAWRQVSAHVTWSGMAPQMWARSIGVRSRVQYRDGSFVESSQSGGFSSFSMTATEAALRARILSTRDLDEQPDRWSPLITLKEQDFARHRGQPGRLEANVDLIAVQTREAGALPQRRGASLDRDGSRLEITAVRRGTDSRTVVIRRWRALSPFSTGGTPEQTFFLRRRASGVALMGGYEGRWQLGGRPNASIMLLGLPFAMLGDPISFGSGDDGFAVETLYLRFPGRGSGAVPDIDIASLDDAELVVLEVVPAGVVTRHLVIDPFVVP